MSKRYGLYGTNSQDFLTWHGRILVHDNQHEMEFMVPDITGAVRELPADVPVNQTVPLLAHPNFTGVTRPITKEQFNT